MTKLNDIMDEFCENDDQILDLTDPKTFCIASAIAILCGVGIGWGYVLIFNSIDCYNAVSGTVVCFPNEYSKYKLPIMIVTLLAGVFTGISPHVIKYFYRKEKENGIFSEDEIE